MNALDRRQFIKSTTFGAAALAASSLRLNAQSVSKAPPSERLQVGCVGVGGRALYLTNAFAGLKEVEVVALADIDPVRLAAAVQSVEKIQGARPAAEKDFRKLLDNREIKQRRHEKAQHRGLIFSICNEHP